MYKEQFQISSQEAITRASEHESDARYHRAQEAITGFIAAGSLVIIAYSAAESLLENSSDTSTLSFAATIIGSLSIVLSRNQSSKANVHEQTAANLRSHAEINQL